MSEFSDGYYLFDVADAKAKSFLRKVGRFAFLFPAQGRWLPVLVEGPDEAGAPLAGFIEHASFIWLHFAFAEDHGLWLRVFDGAVQRARIGIRRRGPSEIDVDAALQALAALGVVGPGREELVRQVLDHATAAGEVDLDRSRSQLSAALEVELFEGWSCADLTHSSPEVLATRAPSASPVLKSKRGKYGQEQPQPEPNQYCPVPGLPRFMYHPLPDGDADPDLVDQHVRHWIETGDFDDEAQEGFWLYTAYSRALPSRYRFLADRMMNLRFFPDYRQAIQQTVRSILAVADQGFDWQPYLARQKGTQRL